ncbi:MAG TPA: cyclic nucleotide-binding domain-containing protein [Candidatus Omnitrophota bacterium]|nr:cyclic nucleotide-binding domain-containing protein [Candidatus Omnitrophota bacterium]
MVQTENLGRIIDEHPFFEGIDAKLRALLVGCAKNERFEAGQFLAREGQKADRFFLVRAGTVAVEIDVPHKDPIVIETVGEGDVVGWSWMVEPYRSSLDVRAVTLVRALSFDAACLRKKMEADHQLGYEVLKRFVPVIAHRMHSARLQMLDLYGPRDGQQPKPAKVEVVKAVKGSKGKNRKADAKLAKPEKPLKATKPEKAKKADKPKKQKKAG